MIPGLVYTVPLFCDFPELELVDSHLGLILAYCTFSCLCPYGVLTFLRDTRELYESGFSGRLLGVPAVLSIALPLVGPAYRCGDLVLLARGTIRLAMCLCFKDTSKTLPWPSTP
jgi:multiple sugar transport system permease protein